MASPLTAIAEWRANVSELVTACCKEWGLRPGEEYVPGVCGHVLRVELPDGSPAVLKVFWPHREAEQEADALERWNGQGAVRLLARDDERHALRLERAVPGTFLSESPDALDVLIELLPRLWKPADGFRTLEEEAEWWIEHDLRRARYADIAIGLLRELAPT